MSLVIVFFTFVRDNWPRRDDLTWLRKGGGLFGGKEVPSHRFNAGEKVVFWGGVLLLGSIVVGSGLVLDKLHPGRGATLRSDMQVAHMIHAVAAVLMMAMFARPHLHRHHRHARRLPRDARRLCRRRLGAGSTTRCGTKTSRPARFRRSAPRSRRRNRRSGLIAALPTLVIASGRTTMRMIHLPLLAAALCAAHAFARLPAPSDDAKAKAAEAAARTAWSAKVAAFQLCQAQDKAVADYHAAMKKAGKTAARRRRCGDALR